MKKIKEKIKVSFPFLLKWYSLFQLSKNEKKVIPSGVRLKYSNNYLYADPFESRGLTVLKGKGAGQPFIKNFWRDSIELFKPELVIDIGANYGEVFVDSNYPDSFRTILAVEANSALFKYLSKSKKRHPFNDRIILLNALASDKNTESVTFYIDQTSSGRSSALQYNFVKKIKKVSVPSIRIDDYILNLKVEFQTLVFKIDVEGFESFVLKGMSKLISSNMKLIGCVEFNLPTFQRNNIDLHEYLDSINRHFYFLLKDQQGDLHSFEVLNIELLKQFFPNTNVEGDILFFSNLELLNKFKHNFIS